MKRNTRDGWAIIMTVGLVLGLLIPTTKAFAQAGVLPPNSRPYGLTLGQWTARWWQWGLSVPFRDPAFTGSIVNPLVDPIHINVGQSGPVWFLAGYGGGAEPTCTVPVGTALLIPIINVECSLVEPAPFHGDNEAQLRACAKSLADGLTDLNAAVDGVPVPNLGRYRVQSPLFAFSYPVDNILGVAGSGASMSISDGYWLFLAPLSVGQHTIHIHGAAPALGFVIDTTWHLTVQ